MASATLSVAKPTLQVQGVILVTCFIDIHIMKATLEVPFSAEATDSCL